MKSKLQRKMVEDMQLRGYAKRTQTTATCGGLVARDRGGGFMEPILIFFGHPIS